MPKQNELKYNELMNLSDGKFSEALEAVEEFLRLTNETYISGDETGITDSEWDTLYNRYTKYDSFNTNAIEPALRGDVECDHFMSDQGGIDIKIQNEEDLDRYINSLTRLIPNGKLKSVVALPKFDGLSVMMHLRDGKVVTGLTRGGDGKGIDITQPVLSMDLSMVPALPGDIYIRGEIVITDRMFEAYRKLTNKNYKDKRSVVAGLVRRLSFGSTCLSNAKHLMVIPFTMEDPNCSRSDILRMVVELKRTAHRYLKTDCFTEFTDDSNIGDLKQLITSMQDTMVTYRDEIDVDLDGSVFYVCYYGDDGVEKFSRFAYKFDPFSTEVVIEGIDWDFSRTTGIMTPVARINTTHAGREFSRVSLANAGRMLREGICIGDTMKFEYRSDVMGYLSKIGDMEPEREGVEIPSSCFHCGEVLELQETEVAQLYSYLRCTNEACSGKFGGRFLNYLNKMGIKGIQDKTVETIVNRLDMGNSIQKFFDLTKEELVECGLGPVQADNFLKFKETPFKSVPDYMILGSQNIPLVSRGRSRVIMSHTTLEELINLIGDDNVDVDTFCELFAGVDNVNHGVLINLYAGLNNDDTMSDIKFLMEYYKDIFTSTMQVAMENSGSDVEGKSFVITGAVKKFKNRKDLEDQLLAKGAKVSGNVTNNTDYLINNDVNSTTGKNKRAKELNVPIISEDEVISMLS